MKSKIFINLFILLIRLLVNVFFITVTNRDHVIWVPVTKRLHVLRFRVEAMASRCLGQLRVY